MSAWGRVRQSTTFLDSGHPVELGPEFLHGDSTSLTKMARNNKWALHELFTWAQGDGGPSKRLLEMVELDITG